MCAPDPDHTEDDARRSFQDFRAGLSPFEVAGPCDRDAPARGIDVPASEVVEAYLKQCPQDRRFRERLTTDAVECPMPVAEGKWAKVRGAPDEKTPV